MMQYACAPKFMAEIECLSSYIQNRDMVDFFHATGYYSGFSKWIVYLKIII